MIRADLLKTVEPRVVYLAMASAVVLTLMASYLYLFKKPQLEYSRLKQARVLLEAKVDAGGYLTGQIETLRGNVAQLTRRLQGESPLLPVSEMVAHAVDRLDQISQSHDIRFVGIKPGQPKTIPMFEEIPFAMEVSGSYFSLYQWLHDVEQALGPMVVKRVELRPQSSPRDLQMKLEMVSYRPSTEDM